MLNMSITEEVTTSKDWCPPIVADPKRNKEKRKIIKHSQTGQSFNEMSEMVNAPHGS